MAQKKFYVISYDVTDDKRRTKVSETLKDFAGCRVQKSVFECRLESKALKKLTESLEEIIDNDTDNILFYNLCESCASKKHSIGLTILGKDEEFKIV